MSAKRQSQKAQVHTGLQLSSAKHTMPAILLHPQLQPDLSHTLRHYNPWHTSLLVMCKTYNNRQQSQHSGELMHQPLPLPALDHALIWVFSSLKCFTLHVIRSSSVLCALQSTSTTSAPTTSCLLFASFANRSVWFCKPRHPAGCSLVFVLSLCRDHLHDCCYTQLPSAPCAWTACSPKGPGCP